MARGQVFAGHPKKLEIVNGRIAVVMNGAVSKEVNVLQRCAVCKIDLKAKFAFIDEEFLSITGYSYEELLGKPVAGVFDPASHDLIVGLMSRRSHFEAVYDSASLTLISKTKQLIRVSVVIFLNFIGGNPVNFQIILSPQVIPNKIESITSDDALLKDFIEKIGAIDVANDWQGILNALLKLSSAGQAGLYGFDKGHLVPMASATDDSSANFTNKELSATLAWHLKIAEAGAEYNFTEGTSVQRAVENNRTAPNEFISTFRIHQDKYMLRLIYSNDVSANDAAKSIERTKLVMPLVCKLANASR